MKMIRKSHNLQNQLNDLIDAHANENKDLGIYGTLCPNNCSNKGYCFQGNCVCIPGYIRDDCSISEENGVIKGCPSNCFNNGSCRDGVCTCDIGFGGIDCSISNHIL